MKLYLSVVFLLDVGEEGGIAEVGFAAGALEVSWFDGDEVIVEGFLCVHGVQSIIYKMRN